MPAPQKSAMTQLAQNSFRGKSIKLPTDWSDPGNQYPDAFPAAERSVAPNSPTTLFKEATLNKYHVDTAKTIGDGFDAYIEGICGAVCGAIDKWMKAAIFTIVSINGPTGVVSPGSVVGPPLLPLIMSEAPKGTAQKAKYSAAIAGALSTLWMAWHAGISGTLAYPSFSYFAGPAGPPTPNTPMPLAGLPSSGESGLSASSLKNAMIGQLGDPQALHAADLFDAVATAFNSVFQTFKTTTMVQNVMGAGPIPAFAPPVNPGGPVVGGAVIPAPGVFS